MKLDSAKRKFAELWAIYNDHVRAAQELTSNISAKNRIIATWIYDLDVLEYKKRFLEQEGAVLLPSKEELILSLANRYDGMVMEEKDRIKTAELIGQLSGYIGNKESGSTNNVMLVSPQLNDYETMALEQQRALADMGRKFALTLEESK